MTLNEQIKCLTNGLRLGDVVLWAQVAILSGLVGLTPWAHFYWGLQSYKVIKLQSYEVIKLQSYKVYMNLSYLKSEVFDWRLGVGNSLECVVVLSHVIVHPLTLDLTLQRQGVEEWVR